MTAVPSAMPFTVPVGVTVAMGVALLLQLPPGVASDRAVVSPWHTCRLPVMAAGDGYTVTIMAAVQPVPNEYVIVVTPGVSPVSMPDVLPIVPAAILLLVHVPPVAPLVKAVVLPAQTCGM